MNTKTAVIIPVYRHAGKLGEVLGGATKHFPRERILVVDDGSTVSMSPGSETPENLAYEYGCPVVRHERNLGKGAALRTGFAYWNRHGMEWVITMDADGQHDPAELPKFIRFAEKGQADLVVGSRMADTAGMPWDRRLSNRFSSFVLSLFARRRIEDAQSGYRLVRLAAINGINWREKGFVFESEMILRLAHHGHRITFIPVRTIYAPDQPSSMQRLPETLRFLRMLVNSVVRP